MEIKGDKMNRNLATVNKLNSSFLSCEKDIETILRKLFVENRPYSDELKRLLIINTKDCLDDLDNQVYLDKLKEMTIGKMIDEGYIKLEPKISFPEHEEVKSYIILTFNNFLPTDNPQFRDCIVTFDVLCHSDYWYLGDYRLRPYKIMGYIDGILNNCKLSGIGTLEFAGCSEIILDETLSGFGLMYRAVHGSDDKIPSPEV
jgi:hypothetical protein